MALADPSWMTFRAYADIYRTTLHLVDTVNTLESGVPMRSGLPGIAPQGYRAARHPARLERPGCLSIQAARMQDWP
jgi:hypothetical protein